MSDTVVSERKKDYGVRIFVDANNIVKWKRDGVLQVCPFSHYGMDCGSECPFFSVNQEMSRVQLRCRVNDVLSCP